MFVGAEWLNLVPRWLEWRRLTVEILWDEEGKWPEVRKSRACSRECPVVWLLWRPEVVILGADQKERGLWRREGFSVAMFTDILFWNRVPTAGSWPELLAMAKLKLRKEGYQTLHQLYTGGNGL